MIILCVRRSFQSLSPPAGSLQRSDSRIRADSAIATTLLLVDRARARRRTDGVLRPRQESNLRPTVPKVGRAMKSNGEVAFKLTSKRGTGVRMIDPRRPGHPSPHHTPIAPPRKGTPQSSGATEFRDDGISGVSGPQRPAARSRIGHTEARSWRPGPDPPGALRAASLGAPVGRIGTAKRWERMVRPARLELATLSSAS
jgi:hypothetical protein